MGSPDDEKMLEEKKEHIISRLALCPVCGAHIAISGRPIGEPFQCFDCGTKLKMGDICLSNLVPTYVRQEQPADE